MESKANAQIHKIKINLGLLKGWSSLAYEIAGSYKDVLENN